MPSTGINNGTLVAIYIGSTKVSHSTDATLSINGETIDVSSKDSQGWRDLIGGQRSWSLSGSGWFAEDATLGYSDLYSYYISRDEIAVLFSTEVSGDNRYSGNALLTSMESTGGVEDAQSYTFSLEGTGVLTEEAVV